MRRSFAGIAVAATCIVGAACNPIKRPESEPSASSAAQDTLNSTPPTRGVKEAQSECREEPAGSRSTEQMKGLGTFGGIMLYGSNGQLYCSEPGLSGVGECELTANSVAIAKGKNGSRALIASSQGTLIWYGDKGVSCVRQLVE